MWDYEITKLGVNKPNFYKNKILVPFPIESSLSGVQKNVGKDNELWYHSIFIVPKSWKGKNIILHFGGVDWKSEIWINDVYVGSHQGGYDPFSFDITSYLNKVAEEIHFGTKNEVFQKHFLQNIDKIDASAFEGEKVIVKGCGHIPLTEDLYIAITKKLQNAVSSLMFGEACSAVPVFKKK